MDVISPSKENDNAIWVCKLCGELFALKEHIPKMLKCGHTFCIVCLSVLVEFTLKCPTCHENVKGPFSELPTNYAVIRGYHPKIAEHSKFKKEKFLSQVGEQKQRVAKIREVAEKLEKIVISCDEKVKSWSDETENLIDLADGFKIIEERLWKLDVAMYCCYNPKIKANFNLGSYSTKEEFLNEIATELYKRKTIYAFKSEWYNTEVRWGRLCYKYGKLYVHSFTTNAPPYPSMFVPFRDLQKCMNTDNFEAFIIIDKEPLVCIMQVSSTMALDFIQLCSGEDGSSFKGLNAEKIVSSEKPEVIKIEINKPKAVENDYEFLYSLPSEAKETLGKMFRIKMCEGRCEIVKNLESFPNSADCRSEGIVVASASSRQVFPDDKTTKIIKDCGIGILLNPTSH